MGLIKKLVLLFVLLLLLWGAYAAYAVVTMAPQLSASWGNVNENETQIIVTAHWKRPLMIPLEVRYAVLNFSGIEIARVERFSYGPLSKGAEVVIGIDNHNIVRALFRYLDNGQRGEATLTFRTFLLKFIPLTFNFSREVNEDILSQMNFTAESMPILGGLAQSPALVSTKVEWKGSTGERGEMVAYMKLYNPNDFPLPIGNLRFNVYANGIKVGSGQTIESVVIPAKGYKTLPVETVIYGNEIPRAWAIHVKNGETSKLRINLYLTVNAFGKNIDVKLFSQEETVKTNIMESINQALQEISKNLSNLGSKLGG
ncbi:LEA type 2 family protein [Thermococcus sp.]|uniref:LEA type 2 family protein n=1 Tax=Thermococcus sp. TaxID=35749 RepID=UPI00261F1B4B|nr:LEA type 2 family protein [Thermococcus sp.]